MDRSRCLAVITLCAAGPFACAPAAVLPPISGGSCTANDAEELGELATLGILDCDLKIADSSLASLDAASPLRQVPAVYVVQNPQLDDISALNSIEQPFLLSVARTRLSGAQTVPTNAQDVSFSQTEMTSLSSDVEAIAGTLHIGRNFSLSTISFPRLTRLGGLGLVQLPAFSDLKSAFPNLEEVGGFSILECPELSSEAIEAFEAQITNSGMARHCGNADDAVCD